MKQNASDRLAIELLKFLKRIYDYSTKHLEHEQPFGACIANPKHSSMPLPTQEIQSELESRATEYFKQTKAVKARKGIVEGASLKKT